MALRAGANEVRQFVSRLVNDVDFETFSEAEVQDALDRHRWEGRYLQLDALPTKASGGTTTYLTYVVPADAWRHWETDGVLYDSNYDTLSPATEDWETGRWTFSTEPTRPVYILGFSHDPYAAAADLLEMRGSELAEEYASFSVYNGSFNTGGAIGKRRGPLEMAAHYRSKARSSVEVTTVYRTDVNIF